MSSRSSRVAPDKIQKVKAAVERNGFPSQKALAVETGLSRATVHNFLNGKPVDRLNFVELSEKLQLDWQDIVYIEGENGVRERSTDSFSVVHPTHRDWGEAIDVGVFYGREAELAILKQWLLGDKCRLVALLGMGGIGKTALSIKFAQQFGDEFDYIIWRSLREAPPIEKVLDDFIQILGDRQVKNIPESVGDKITLLVEFLRQFRCLLVLDNVESILAEKIQAGQYQRGYEDYGNLFRRIGGSFHQSCLLFTSREKPQEIAISEGGSLPVRSLQLTGLQSAALKILQDKGVTGTPDRLLELVQLYGGSPLALKIIATSIVQLFAGNVSEFLAQGTTIFNGIGKLLETQIDRLSEFDRTIVFWLAIEREPMTIAQLREDILPEPSLSRLLESLENLKHRSLVETVDGGFTLQNVVMEYILDRLVEDAIAEIHTHQFDVLDRYTFIKATAKDYIRETQTRLILKPIADRFSGDIESIRSSLAALKATSPRANSYAAANLLDLLLYPNKTLHGADFSGLTIRQAYLQGMTLHEVNFQGSHFQDCVFSNFLSSVFTVAFSPDGTLLATGEARGEVRVWDVATGKPLLVLPGHTAWVRSVAFSPDGTLLASASEDRTIRFWDTPSGHCVNLLRGHDDRVRAISWSPDGATLASSSDDRTIRLWDTQTGECRHTLTGHRHRIYTIAFSPDGATLASGSRDCAIKLWDLATGLCSATLKGHCQGVSSVEFSPDGTLIASGSRDKTLKLWHLETGEMLRTLTGHSNGVALIRFHPNGQILASGGIDNTTRLWNPQTGECRQILRGHEAWVHSLDFSPEGDILASGSVDGAVKLWNSNTGECLTTWQGYDSSIKCVAFSPDGNLIASGSDDKILRVWDATTGKCLHPWPDHVGVILSVAFSRDGRFLASASSGIDRTIRLWDLTEGRCWKTLTGHDGAVWRVAWSPDGRTLVSCSSDRTLKIWDVFGSTPPKTLTGHAEGLNSVTFSPDGMRIASGSDDRTIRLWNTQTGEVANILTGHGDFVRTAIFSPDGTQLISGSDDRTIRLWDTQTGDCLQVLSDLGSGIHQVTLSPDGSILASTNADRTVQLWNWPAGTPLGTLEGHTHIVWWSAFRPDGKAIVTGSEDETMKVWDVETGACLQTLKLPGPYEGLNLTNATGLTEPQKSALQALGAVVW